jgi:hypothetical protein
MANEPQPPTFWQQMQRAVPTLLLTAVIAFATSWWNSQMVLNDLRYRLDRLEERQREAAAAMSEAAQTSQRNAIRLAELGVLQTNVAEQLRDLKAEHEKLLRR